MRVLHWGIFGLSSIGVLLACQNINAVSSHPALRTDLAVHLSGTDVHVFEHDPNFVEESRVIMPGVKYLDGCSYTMTTSSKGPPAGRVAEVNESTCEYIAAYGHYKSRPAPRPDAIVDTTRKTDPVRST